jgi:3-hydroxy acid dehydrogenase/malonic semialdehyde reductase
MTRSREELVVVSGASSGIGLAMAKALLDEGYHVLGLAKEFSDSVVEHEQFSKVQLDLSKLEALPAEISRIIDANTLPIKAVVNNAGIGKMGKLEQLSLSDIQAVMDTNFMSHVIVTKCFLPGLKKQGQADIVFTGSEAALQGARQGSIYCASKFAIRGFAQALREECAKSDVRVTLINPGAVRTAFFDKLHFEPGARPENAIEPEDIAKALIMVLEARPGTVFDEINLSPLTHVWQRK